MRGWRACLVLLALPLAGCGSSDAASALGNGAPLPEPAHRNPSGGQTGSLTPPGTGVAVDTSQALIVPGGDGVVIVHGCTNLTPENIRVSDSNGERISIELFPLTGGRCLVRAPGMLAAGNYSVQIDGATNAASVPLTVSDPLPLPTRVGDLFQEATTVCGSARLRLVLDGAAAAYVPLMGLSWTLDGVPRGTLVHHGLMHAEDGSALIDLGNLDAGGHQLVVQASIAGETSAPDPAVSDVSVSCQPVQAVPRPATPAAGSPAAQPSDDEWHGPVESCAMGRTLPRSGGLTGALAAALGFLAWARRRFGSLAKGSRA
jgi:hypothetical protein